ncbi:MAG: hypothetical protein KGJ80_01335 [Chloroflexota bacterium]|nr:hypothetical protein [Chloroflexota bacterium]
MATIEEITALLQGISPQGLEQVRSFVEFLKRKESQPAGSAWSFDFLEHFGAATLSASRDRAGMEIKVADATCGGVTRAALWEHPPASGSAIIGYLVPIPTGLRGLVLKFSIGIRDGAELPKDRSVAFRVLVNGWKLWSTLKNVPAWQPYALEMPQLGSDVARIEFVTDGLGDSRWNWAVWAEPRLEGEAQ